MKQGEREVTDYYMEMMSLWQELDLSTEEEWECAPDSVRYKKKSFLRGSAMTWTMFKGECLVDALCLCCRSYSQM